MVNFSADYSGISDLRLVDNCLKMTVYDMIGGNQSKTATLKIPKMINSLFFIIYLAYLCFNYSDKAKINVYSPENEKFSGDCTVERE